MDLMTLLVLFGAVVALLLQGGSCLFNDDRPFSIGFLDLILAGVTLYLMIAMMWGRLVIGTELGVVFVQGTWPVVLLCSSLVAAAVLPVLCFYRICALNDWKRSLWWPLAIGIAFGTLASSQIRVLNAGEVEALRVYSYDAWSAPLILWLTTCCAASVLALIKADQRWMYLLFASAIMTPLAAFVQRWPATADHAGWSWWILERASFAVAACCFAWRLMTVESADRGYRRIAKWMAVPAALALAFAFLPMSFGLRLVFGAIPLVIFTAGITAFVVESQRDMAPPAGDAAPTDDARRPASPALDAATQTLHAASQKLQAAKRTVRIGRIPAVALALVWPIVALGLIDLLALGMLPRVVDFAVIFVLWILLAERLAERALENLPEWFKSLWQLQVVRDAWEFVKGLPEAVMNAASTTTKSVTDGKGGWAAVAAKTLIAVIATLIVITVIAEVMTYRPIVVTSFDWIGSDDAKDKARAKAVSSLLINALGRLRHDLQTDLRNAQPKRSGSEHAELLLAAGAESTALESTVAKSDELEVGSVKVPLETFFRPIQAMVRSVLGVRVIHGTLWKTGGDRTVIMMNTSDGDSWREVEPAAPPKSETQQAVKPETNEAASSCSADATEDIDPTTATVERLAYHIATTDPAFLAAGLTKDYEAFVYFRRGLRHWNAFEAGATRTWLHRAIHCFREAVDRDRKFSAGHFRLGVALHTQGQPRSAVESFRASTANNPAFIPGALQEAATLYYSDYAGPRAAVLLATADEGNGRGEARAVWSRIVMLPGEMVSAADRRAAYYGICRHEFDAAQSRGDGDFSLPYFFCSRAAAMWHRLPREARDLEEKSVESNLLGMLGVILEAHHGDTRVLPPDTRPCFADQIDEETVTDTGAVKQFRLTGSARTRMAMRYFRRSLAIGSDHPYGRCKLASATAYLTGDQREMGLLSQMVPARLSLGSELANAATDWAKREVKDADKKRQRALATFYYQRAMAEYANAVALDRSSVDALDGYSYTAWKWALDAMERDTVDPPDTETLRAAERYAREAVRITEAWRAPVAARWATAATLGEILLAQGRPHEAIEHLEALKSADWASVNEVRWDLAQAKFCAAVQLGNEGTALRRDAHTVFNEILNTERGQEMRPFTAARERLDGARRGSICAKAPDEAADSKAPYVLRAVEYASALACDTSEVSGVIVVDAGKDVDARLFVFGGGVDDHARADATGQQTIRLESPRRARQRYYFARLEDDKGAPLSPTVSVSTFAPKDKDDCEKSAIKLLFGPRTAAADAVRTAAVQPAASVQEGR